MAPPPAVTRAIAATLLTAAVSAGLAACSLHMPGTSASGNPMPTPAEQGEGARLLATVEALVAFDRKNLDPFSNRQCAEWIEERLATTGMAVQRERYEATGGSYTNVWIDVPGTSAPERFIVVGAHYDAAHGTPGADDNASGVAGLLWLAERVARAPLPLSVRFIAFSNEEPPLFQTDSMGSLVHARGHEERGEDVVAMVSLETIGFYSDAPDSQAYPAPFSWFYPSTGDFLAFVGNSRSIGLTRDLVRAFRSHATLPSEGAAVPDLFPGIGWSDHWSYWQVGVPAVMVTDTAIFRNPHYHEPTDTPETLDPVRMARAVVGLEAALREVADEL